MTVQQAICPYTGLRSFTEEEVFISRAVTCRPDHFSFGAKQIPDGNRGFREGKLSLIYAGPDPQ